MWFILRIVREIWTTRFEICEDSWSEFNTAFYAAFHAQTGRFPTIIELYAGQWNWTRRYDDLARIAADIEADPNPDYAAEYAAL